MGRSSSPTWETSAYGRFSKIDRLPVCVKQQRIDTCAVSASPPRLVPPGSLPSGLGSYEVACPTSQELYVFDVNGTHQFTMSLVTGDYMYNFSYRLVGGQRSSITRIERALTYIHYIMCTRTALLSVFLIFSNEEDVTAVTDSNGNTLRIRRDTNRMPVRVVAPDNQVRRLNTAFLKVASVNH